MTTPQPEFFPEPAYFSQTFLPDGDGLHFSAKPPSDIDNDRYLHSANPWEVLACILARAQGGRFDATPRLVSVINRCDDALIWGACVDLIGFAGSHDLVADLWAEFEGRIDDRGVQYYIATALSNCCALWTVPNLLRLHEAATDKDVLWHVQSCLSQLLEPETAAIWSGPARVPQPDVPIEFAETYLDREGYRTLVMERLAELKSQGLDDRRAVVEGEELSLRNVALRLRWRVQSGDSGDRVEWERMVLEAATGISFRGLFDQNGMLRRLDAEAILEELLESERLAPYLPGVRYFFGHRVP